jgi:hypothetical protein
LDARILRLLVPYLAWFVSNFDTIKKPSRLRH